MNNFLRWKIKTITEHITIKLQSSYYPEWNFDGSSTGQATGVNTEILLRPVRVYNFPFEEADVIVLCETYNIDGTPHETNKRHDAINIFQQGNHKPWFGNEIEYFIYDPHIVETDLSSSQTLHYCGFNATRSLYKQIALEHYNACLRANLSISGMNAEVTKGQWEFQIGPCEGIKSGDQSTVAKFLLIWIAEYYSCGIIINDSKPYNDVNGSGCHINFSTEETRSNNDEETLINLIKNLGKRHEYHMSIYGDNSKRMTGTHETANPDKFDYGTGTRHTSIRIPNNTKTYFEDRRPSSNIDYYEVTSAIYESCCIKK